MRACSKVKGQTVLHKASFSKSHFQNIPGQYDPHNCLSPSEGCIHTVWPVCLKTKSTKLPWKHTTARGHLFKPALLARETSDGVPSPHAQKREQALLAMNRQAAQFVHFSRAGDHCERVLWELGGHTHLLRLNVVCIQHICHPPYGALVKKHFKAWGCSAVSTPPAPQRPADFMI